MDQDKTDPAQRPQTLLEAAKAATSPHDTHAACSAALRNLRAAIAREEAMQGDNPLLHPLQFWIEEGQKRLDRAQQAESTAAWHKAESERLSAELAKAKAGIGVDGFRAYLDDVRNELECAPDETTSHAAKAMRQRAEKAEAELAKLGQQLARLCELQANPPVIVTQPFEGDPQTCAFGSNAFGGKPKRDDDDDDPVDPTTGFTFATYRRLLEALGGKS